MLLGVCMHEAGWSNQFCLPVTLLDQQKSKYITIADYIPKVSCCTWELINLNHLDPLAQLRTDITFPQFWATFSYSSQLFYVHLENL